MPGSAIPVGRIGGIFADGQLGVVRGYAEHHWPGRVGNDHVSAAGFEESLKLLSISKRTIVSVLECSATELSLKVLKRPLVLGCQPEHGARTPEEGLPGIRIDRGEFLKVLRDYHEAEPVFSTNLGRIAESLYLAE